MCLLCCISLGSMAQHNDVNEMLADAVRRSRQKNNRKMRLVVPGAGIEPARLY